MAATMSLRDLGVLEKIKDPEANPATGPLIEPSLPKDPHITDDATYQRVVQRERDIVVNMQHLEEQLASLKTEPGSTHFEAYRSCIEDLDALISEFPSYASARNNRVQAFRSLYSDSLLMQEASQTTGSLVQLAAQGRSQSKSKVAETVLSDLETAISLLSSRDLFSGISPTAAKTLSTAYTQRAALYHGTAKFLASGGTVELESSRIESAWSTVDFEEAASHDFAMGGRYGNEIAKGLAVSTNPTAKLCGQMVREMMRKEYGEE